MNRKPKSRVKSIGGILLAIGILLLITGLLCLMFTDISFSWWIIVGSMLSNIVGITMMTSKTR